jgi:hexokinase
VRALINDTPGTLLAGALKEPKATAGLILGTGTNLCFIDKAPRPSPY